MKKDALYKLYMFLFFYMSIDITHVVSRGKSYYWLANIATYLIFYNKLNEYLKTVESCSTQLNNFTLIILGIKILFLFE